MDFYDFAEKGVEKACETLGIEKPDVIFYQIEDGEDCNIHSVFFKDDYSIGFDISAFHHPFQIVAAAFHESRHAFQWQIIKGLYDGEEIISNITKEKWKMEFSEYKPPSKNARLEKQYLIQDIEIDAILFAYRECKDFLDAEDLAPVELMYLISENDV